AADDEEARSRRALDLCRQPADETAVVGLRRKVKDEERGLLLRWIGRGDETAPLIAIAHAREARPQQLRRRRLRQLFVRPRAGQRLELRGSDDAQEARVRLFGSLEADWHHAPPSRSSSKMFVPRPGRDSHSKCSAKRRRPSFVRVSSQRETPPSSAPLALSCA